MKATDEINWHEDSWFSPHWADRATDEFKAWWLRWQGRPDEFQDRDDYWMACGFALMGWLAGRKQILEATNRE